MAEFVSGVLHADVLAAGLEWAQRGWRTRPFAEDQVVWAFDPSQGVPVEQRRWYRATVLRAYEQYVRVRFDEGRAGAPRAWRVGYERTLYRANIRVDLDFLENEDREPGSSLPAA